MGTRSITRVNTTNGRKLVKLYRQFDGYLAGHGQELFNFLDGFKTVNGYDGSEGQKAANGAGCLAAQLITHFKTSQGASEHRAGKLIGGFYLHDPSDSEGEEFNYTIIVNEETGAIDVEVDYYGKSFVGTLAEFGEYVANPPDDEE